MRSTGAPLKLLNSVKIVQNLRIKKFSKFSMKFFSAFYIAYEMVFRVRPTKSINSAEKCTKWVIELCWFFKQLAISSVSLYWFGSECVVICSRYRSNVWDQKSWKKPKKCENFQNFKLIFLENYWRDGQKFYIFGQPRGRGVRWRHHFRNRAWVA